MSVPTQTLTLALALNLTLTLYVSEKWPFEQVNCYRFMMLNNIAFSPVVKLFFVGDVPFEPQMLNLCRDPSRHTDCQILFFYLDPLLSCGWKQCEWAIIMAKLAMRMRGVTWPGRRGSSETTYLESTTQICLFYGAFMGLQRWLKGVYMAALSL